MQLRLKTIFLCGGVLALLTPWFHLGAQTLEWETAKSNAMAAATMQGKLVLLVAGTPTCSTCTEVRTVLCESTTPPIQQLIHYGYVPWYSDRHTSTESDVYTTGLGFFGLPLVCVIDPKFPDSYLDRTTGSQSAPVFYSRLLTRADNPLKRSVIADFSLGNGVVNFSVTNLVFAATNRIERSSDLVWWEVAGDFVSLSRGSNWSQSLPDDSSQWFYRVESRK